MEIKKEFIFERDPAAKSCHASTVLRLPDDTWIAAWFAGTDEGADDVRIKYAVRSGDGWSAPAQIPGQEPVAHWNPVLFLIKDGGVRLFFKEGKTIADWVTKYTDSFDGGVTWTRPAFLATGDATGGRGPVKNKCVRTSAGTILAPASTEKNGDWKCFIDRSADDGETWTKVPIPRPQDKTGRPVQLIQPTIWEDSLQTLHCLMRSKNGAIYKSASYDNGYTWEPAYPTDVPNNNSGLDCVAARDGTVWLVCNPVSTDERSPLSLLCSTDNGRSFREAAQLEQEVGAEFSYPAIIADEKRLYITYTYKREKIMFAEVTI